MSDFEERDVSFCEFLLVVTHHRGLRFYRPVSYWSHLKEIFTIMSKFQIWMRNADFANIQSTSYNVVFLFDLKLLEWLRHLSGIEEIWSSFKNIRRVSIGVMIYKIYIMFTKCRFDKNGQWRLFGNQWANYVERSGICGCKPLWFSFSTQNHYLEESIMIFRGWKHPGLPS